MSEIFEELGDGIYRCRFRELDQNIGLVVGESGSLVIDTRSLPMHAAVVRAAVAKVTAQPVQWVVNTHWHWDHVLGNAVFSSAEIWGHERCRQVMLDAPDQLVAASQQNFGDLAADLEPSQVVPPDQVFADSASIDVGGRSVRLAFCGRGHTDADISVLIDGVLFAGDLLEEGAPPSFGDSYPLEWPATVERHLEPAPQLVVPGHGDTMSPTAAVGQVEELREVARRCAAAELDSVGAPYPPAVMQVAYSRARIES